MLLPRAVLVVALFGVADVVSAQVAPPFDLMRPPTQERSTVVRHTVPAWLALPADARVLTSEGLEMRPLRNAAVSYENVALGVLVGALRNAGRCATDVRVFLQYTDERWQPLGSRIESEARVSTVAPDGTLPYRFRLRRRDDFSTPPAGYILQVVEGDRPVASTLQWVSTTTVRDTRPCAPPVVQTEASVTRARSTLSGYRVDGTLVVTDGGPVRPDAVTLTALLLDGAGDVLEVLVGVPNVDPRRPSNVMAKGERVTFKLSSPVPIGNDVASRLVFVDVLPDAVVGKQ